MERIHFSKLFKALEEMEKSPDPVPFSLTFVKRSTGKIVHVPSCTLTSFHTKGSTLNILHPGETKPKSVRKCLITEFNGKSVYP